MKTLKFFIIVSLSSLIIFSACLKKTEKEVSDQQTAELRSTASDFMQSLKSVLVKEIQTNGIVSAVSVCSDTAQALTNNIGHEKDVIIKRVSFRNRNPFNKPDEFESNTLKEFEAWFVNGELLPQTEIVSIETENGRQFIRYIKPIFVQPECLGCHGSENEIPDGVKSLLNSKYPEDKAVNFKTGDLRGAISVKKEI